MRTKMLESNMQINNDNINQTVEWIKTRLGEQGFDRSNIIRNSFAVEEILLRYQKKMPDCRFNITTRRILNHYKIAIEIEGESFDFNMEAIKTDGEPLVYLINTIEKSVSWQYVNGKNYITLILKRTPKIPEAVGILMGAVLALAVSLLLPRQSGGLIAVFNDLIIPTIQSKLNGILRMIAGLMVFFSISSGIYAMKNIETLKNTLTKILSRIFLNHAGMTIITILLFAAYFGIGRSASSMAFEGIWNLIMDMLPTDVFSPFIEGNVIQITVIAVTVGTMLLINGNSQKIVYDTLAGGSTIVNMAMQNFCRLMPAFVFINLVSVFVDNSIERFAAIIIPILIGLASITIIILIQICKIWIRYKIPPAEYIKKCYPAMLVGLSTASTSASLNSIKNDLLAMGIEEQYIDLLLPLEQVFYKPFSIIIVMTGAFAYSNIAGISFSVESLIALFVLTQIIAIACPSIPGGMLSCLTILVSQMGFPESSMGVLVTISTLMDYFGTMLSVTSIQSEIIERACVEKKISRNA